MNKHQFRPNDNHRFIGFILFHLFAAVLSETFFLLRQTQRGSEQFLGLLERGLVVPDFNLAAELPAIAQLWRRYQNVPMSPADGYLVLTAEGEWHTAIFTLDSDFKIDRRHGWQVIPLNLAGNVVMALRQDGVRLESRLKPDPSYRATPKA